MTAAAIQTTNMKDARIGRNGYGYAGNPAIQLAVIRPAILPHHTEIFDAMHFDMTSGENVWTGRKRTRKAILRESYKVDAMSLCYCPMRGSTLAATSILNQYASTFF
jgi:hypothetical protein